MSDLDYAREEFKKRRSAFIIARDKKILAESEERGVAPFFSAVANVKVKGASLADRVVGKAVALLSAYAGIASVYALVVSEHAVPVLERYDIHFEYERVVPMILNQRKDDQCPIESIVMPCDSAEEAFTLLKKKFEG